MRMSSEVWVIPKFLDLNYDTVPIRVGHPLLGVHSCICVCFCDGGLWNCEKPRKITSLSIEGEASIWFA